MSRDELLNAILENLDTIKSTESMNELDVAHIELCNTVERYALAHRRRLNQTAPTVRKACASSGTREKRIRQKAR